MANNLEREPHIVLDDGRGAVESVSAQPLGEDAACLRERLDQRDKN
jgi:hypothetical protein